MPRENVFIGVDAGGSKTQLLACLSPSDEEILLTGPPANLQRLGQDQTARVLTTLIRQALERRPQARLAGLCAGVAGAGRASDQAALTERLHQLLGDQAPPRLLVVHDGEVAVEAAFEGASGVVVIAGTGSLVIARTRAGALLRAGGWGYLLGDEGSGYAVGLQGLRAVAAAYDDGPAHRLQALLAERYGLADPEALVHRVYGDHWPVQQMAPLVVEAAAEGDVEARRIIAEQTEALALQVARLARRGPAIAPQAALMGGLMREPYYRQAFTEALHAQLPGWQVQTPLHEPVVGALRLARKDCPT